MTTLTAPSINEKHFNPNTIKTSLGRLQALRGEVQTGGRCFRGRFSHRRLEGGGRQEDGGGAGGSQEEDGGRSEPFLFPCTSLWLDELVVRMRVNLYALAASRFVH